MERPNIVSSVPIAPILGVNVSVVSMESAVKTIGGWVADGASRFVCVADVNSVVLGHSDPQHRKALNDADMVTPDGTPLVWVNRLRGIKDISRVPGADLLSAVCEKSAENGWRHYFYGGAEGVADQLAAILRRKYPGIQIVGTECPPFRELSPAEEAETISKIRRSQADFVWVGLGCPKQERWMEKNCRHIDGVVMIGIGAAFDFHTDRIERAPAIMRNNGLEWLHRLWSEPRRLWYRYLVHAPKFVILSTLETLKLRWTNVTPKDRVQLD